MRTLVLLVTIPATIFVPLAFVLRSCSGTAKPLWHFVTRRES
jgi:hypothetical protein